MDKSACRTKKNLRKIYKKRTYYFIITIVLCLCLVQFMYSTVFNFTKYVVLNKQIDQLEELNRSAIKHNKKLKNQLEVYSSYKGIEELARNNLKMVGKNEVLVLIKNKEN